mgnify:CR=1 FL=1
MTRLFVATAAAALLLTACGGEPAPAAPAEPTAPVESSTTPAAPDATALPMPAAFMPASSCRKSMGRSVDQAERLPPSGASG